LLSRVVRESRVTFKVRINVRGDGHDTDMSESTWLRSHEVQQSRSTSDQPAPLKLGTFSPPEPPIKLRRILLSNKPNLNCLLSAATRDFQSDFIAPGVNIARRCSIYFRLPLTSRAGRLRQTWPYPLRAFSLLFYLSIQPSLAAEAFPSRQPWRQITARGACWSPIL